MVRLQRVTFLALHNYLGLTTELFNPVSAGPWSVMSFPGESATPSAKTGAVSFGPGRRHWCQVWDALIRPRSVVATPICPGGEESCMYQPLVSPGTPHTLTPFPPGEPGPPPRVRSQCCCWEGQEAIAVCSRRAVPRARRPRYNPHWPPA